MIDKIVAGISASEVVTWLVIAALVVYFIYKEWPEFRRRVSGNAVKASAGEAESKSIVGRLDKIEQRLDSIDQKLQRDYDHINGLETQTQKNAVSASESLEERGIIMSEPFPKKRTAKQRKTLNALGDESSCGVRRRGEG